MAPYGLRPWSTAPWRDLDQLRQEVDGLFGRFAGAGQPSAWQGVYPAVNLYETPEAYTLTAELPGIEAKEIQVSVEGSTVTLQGRREIDYGAQEGTSLHRRERQAGNFRRAFELPASIDTDRVEAAHKNGVLLLRLPKTPEHQPRQISVQAL